MADVELSSVVRSGMIASIEASIGASPILQIRSLAKPATCADPDTGFVLATLLLPADWMQNPVAGAASKSGTWQDINADSTGTAEHFSIYDAGLAVRHMQGDVTVTGGGGAMEINNVNIVIAQMVTVTAFSLTAGNS